jgi:hypothetical protein
LSQPLNSDHQERTPEHVLLQSVPFNSAAILSLGGRKGIGPVPCYIPDYDNQTVLLPAMLSLSLLLAFAWCVCVCASVDTFQSCRACSTGRGSSSLQQTNKQHVCLEQVVSQRAGCGHKNL